MRLSSGKINNLLGVPSNPEPGEFYLIEYSGITQLYFSNTSSELILLNEYATNVTVGDGEIVFGGAGNTLLSDPDFTFASGVLSVDSVLVQDEVYGVGWNASLGVPTKNAIYDKIESLSFSIPDGDKGDITVSSAGSTWTIDAQNSAFWRGKVSDETGSGAWVFNDTPSLIAPLLGTPTSGNLSNCTALPISTGVSGLGANVATFLATPSSANLYSALTTKTGTGSNVFANAPLLSGAVVLSSGSLYLTGASNTAATSLDGLVLEAGNLADATHDYWSPALRMTGSSYRTTGGLSDYAEFKTEVQAVTHLTQFNNFGNYVISSGVTDTAPGASTFTPIFTLSSLGALSIVGDVTAPTFIGALTGNASTATALQNARTIGGVSFNGTANIVPQTIQSVNEATDTTCFPLFISASGSQSLQPLNNAGFTYNSATNALTATTFIGALTGNASTATALANARTIGGVSFDGTANITVVSATGDFNVTSKLGVGVTATKTLHVQGPNTTSSYYAIFQNSSGLQPFTIQGDGNVNIGATASSANNSRLYVYGGGNGANVDVRGVSGATTDQAIIELEGNDYDTQTKSAYLLFRGSTFTGSYMGFTNANLGLLMFNGDTSVIGTLNTDIIFAPNFGERARIKTDGTFVTNGTVGLTGTRVSKGWFTDVESTNMYTVGGVSLNSTFQPLDSDLTTIAGLTATTDNFIVSVASAWASRTPAQVKTTLSLNNVENTALSTWAGTANITTLGTISTGTWQAGIISSTYGGTGVNNGGRTLTLGTNSGTIAFSAASKTVTFAKSITFDGTDSTTMTFPASSATVAGLGITQTFTGINTFTPTARSSGVASYFTVTTPADTGQTAATESIGVNFTAATRTWADGTTVLQRERVFAAPTYNKTTTAATFTTAVNVDIADPIAGVGVTLTNNYSLRAANVLFTGVIKAGSTPTTLTDSAGKILSAALNTVGVGVGGTGTATTFTTGSVVFAGASGVYTQDNSNFFWDDTNNRLGIGTASPGTALDIQGGGIFRVGGSTSPSYPASGEGFEMAYDTDANHLGAAGSGVAVFQAYSRTSSLWRDVWFRGNNITFSTNATNVLTLLASNSSAGIGNTAPSAKLDIIATTEQLRVGYNTSNYYKTTVGSTGGVTFDAVGSGALFTFSDPVVARRKLRVYSTTSTATLTPEIDTYDEFSLTAQAVALNIANHSTSTPNDGDTIIIRIIDNGTARAITYGTNYVAKGGIALPSTTVLSKHITLGFKWFGNISKWNLMSVNQE